MYDDQLSFPLGIADFQRQLEGPRILFFVHKTHIYVILGISTCIINALTHVEKTHAHAEFDSEHIKKLLDFSLDR